MLPAPSLFENFNARNLSALDVARTFVPSSAFSRLLAKNHTLVIGPRGSGKTTLLKMCQQQALDAWEGENAEVYRQKVDFTGVLVPTDVSWGRQIQSLGAEGLDEADRVLMGIAAFTTNVLRALATRMEIRAQIRPRCRPNAKMIAAKKEAEVVRDISAAWLLPPQFVTFQSLKHRLSHRLSEIHVIASQEARQPESERGRILTASAFLHLSFLKSALSAIELFNDAVGEPDGRWALLFDELELAPTSIVDTLLEALRSVDDRFLFKLSLAPFSDDVEKLQSALSATPGNDYSVIRLWFPHKEEGKPFCRDLWDSLLASGGFPQEDPEVVLGTSILTTAVEEWSESEFATAYRPGTKQMKRMKSLAAKDSTFEAFLRDHHIDIDQVHELHGDDRAKSVRKAVAIVALRDELRDKGGALRSRKVVTLYSGADALFAIAEGNPRWFKGIIGELLRDCVPGTPPRIKPEKQARQIAKAGDRFFALLRTIPVPSLTSTSQQQQNLPSLLGAIGDFFFRAQVLDAFSVDPPGRFKVDRDAGRGLVESLGQALNAGAIVSMAESEDKSAHLKVSGEEFRLSYLLASNYKLLLRTGRAVSLHSIFDSLNAPAVPTLFKDLDGDLT